MEAETITSAVSLVPHLTREVPTPCLHHPHHSKGQHVMTYTLATLDMSNSQTPRVEDHLELVTRS